jgi:LPXTG-site transpeptidase (sortase) family protein
MKLGKQNFVRRNHKLFTKLKLLSANLVNISIANRRVLIGLVIGLALIGFGVKEFYPQYKATNSSDTALPSPETVVIDSTDSPSEVKPTVSDEDFKVAADQPRMIKISSIGAEGYIQKVGVNKNGQMAAPTNIYFGGWFVDSVKPGDKGLSIIDGHYGGKYSNGIFYNLKALEPGATFVVQYGDLSERTFKVVSTKEVPIKDAQTLLYERKKEIDNQLNLITCGGEYNKDQSTYDNRVITVAERI